MIRAICGALFIAAAAASEDSSLLVVNRPKSLLDKYKATNGTIEQRPAMFGIPAYGHQAQLSGSVIYVPADDLAGCNPINKEELNFPAGGLVILMVERGNCSFVLKVQHAQDAGANAAIIVDNKVERYLPYMADDGKGSSISIPSMLIHMDDGAAIVAELNQQNQVILTMGWNIPHLDNTVEWQLWTSADDQMAAQFKRDFDKAAQVLGEAASFQPHYYVDNGLYNDCYEADATAPEKCPGRCILSGRYCSLEQRGSVSGTKVVEENLRQLCLIEELKKIERQVGWWNYVENFEAECPDFTKECSERIMAQDDVGVDVELVKLCVTDSTTDGINKLLEAEMTLRRELQVWKQPQVLVNGMYYNGNLGCVPPIDVTTCGVLATICLGFKNVSSIPACISSPDCELGQVKDKCGKCGGNGKFDACGQCNQLDEGKFNQSCMGCDGIPNSAQENDVCGVCNGPGRDACQRCFPVGDARRIENEADCTAADSGTIPMHWVIVIIITVIGVVGIVAYLWMRHKNKALKEDIDALLKQYVPIDGPVASDEYAN